MGGHDGIERHPVRLESVGFRREKVAAGHFEEFVKYLGGLQQKGAIESHTEGVGVIHGVTGDEIMKRMAIWTSAIPS